MYSPGLKKETPGEAMNSECIQCLKLLELRVPRHTLVGAPAILSCRWALEPHEMLYSVKWYKDGKEFFRHVPKNEEPRKKFTLPGVEVEAYDPSGSNVTLSPVTLESSGRYRCEVSGEKPLFPTVSDHADMEVMVLPDHGPLLVGLRPRYRVGDRTEVACVSGRSWPETQLSWYINGEPAKVPDVRPPTYKDEQGLKTTKLVLDFIITEKHFKDNRIKVKCLATLFPYYWRSNEESALKHRNQIYRHIEVESTQIDLKTDPVRHQIRMSASSAGPIIRNAFSVLRVGIAACLAIHKIR